MNKPVSDLIETDNRLKPIDTGIKTAGSVSGNIRAVVFDIYGTLLVSGSGDVGTALEAGSIEAFQTAFKKAGGIELSAESAGQIRKYFFEGIEADHTELKSRGIPYPEVDIVEIWTAVIKKALSNGLYQSSETIEAENIAAAYESTVNPVSEMPGAANLLQRLSSGGLKLGIVSNAQFYTPLVFAKIFGKDFSEIGFDEDLCFFSYRERHSKPDTFLFKKLADRLSNQGIEPSEAVFVGNDMLKDIMPAAVTGYKTALFAGDRRSLRLREDHDACRNIKPDVILNSLVDLTDLIQDGKHEKTF